MPKLSKLKLKRITAQLTLDDVRMNTQIDSGKLSRIERGYAEATEEEREKLADYLDCNIEDIF